MTDDELVVKLRSHYALGKELLVEAGHRGIEVEVSWIESYGNTANSKGYSLTQFFMLQTVRSSYKLNISRTTTERL